MAKKGKYYQRKDGLFETIKTINGKRVAFRGKTCREVDQKILAYKEEEEKGRKVSDIISAWEEDKQKKVTESSMKTYSAALRQINEQLGDMRASQVKPIDCARILEHMALQGHHAGTVRMYKSILVQLFRYAVIQGDIDVSPAAEIELPRNLTRMKRDSLTADQIDAVLKFRGEWWQLGIAFLMTGCRRGELMALRYEDIDRKGKTIRINKKVNYRLGRAVLENHLKTEAGNRLIPLLPDLEDALPKNRIGLIFHKDGEIIQEWHFNKIWSEYRASVGLPNNITPHWFRHTFATICRDAEVDLKTTAEFMGHSNEAITAAIYTHKSENHQKKQVEKLAKFVSAM